jgi:hypothetical protein
MKGKLFNLFCATHKASIFKIMGARLSQMTQKSSTFLQTNHMKDNLFENFDAKHVKGISARFDLELTCIMPSRDRFINLCSIEVDSLARLPIHTIDKANNVCAW